MRVQHVFLLFFFARLGGQCPAGRGLRAIRLNAENLVEAKSGKKLVAAGRAMDDPKIAAAEFLQTKRHTRHGAHEGRIHRGAVIEVDDEFAVAALDHFPGKLLQIAAV